MKENVKEEKVMKILIFTCLCQRATHVDDAALDPLQMLLVLFAAHNEGKDVFLQLKTWHAIRMPCRKGKRRQRVRARSAACTQNRMYVCQFGLNGASQETDINIRKKEARNKKYLQQ